MNKHSNAVAHTPGPWTLAGGNSRGDGTKHFVWSDADERSDWERESAVATVHLSREHPNEFEANARLIAAAPDLVEALRGVLEAFDWHPDTADFRPTGTDIKLHDIVRAALDKAGV